MLDKYGVHHDSYCYPDSDVLINLLGIKDAQQLSEAETEFTTERYLTYESNCSSPTDFSIEHLQHLHHHLFQDLYEWAGKVREVDISKDDTRFCTCSRIAPDAQKVLAPIVQLTEIATHSSRADFVRSIADLYCEMNILHPFREGNGRVQRFFFEELLFTLGYEVKWPDIPEKDWVDANVAGYNLDLAPLIAIFNEAIIDR